MELLFVVLALLILAWTSMRWGVDSREDIDSPEWERRQAW